MIESVNNQKILSARKLLQKKYRYENGQYLIEGEKLLREAEEKGQKVLSVFATNQCNVLSNTEITLVSQKVLDSLCQTVTNQGIVAVLQMPQSSLSAPRGNCLILENLQDAGNLGTIMRTAVACGYSQVYLINCVDPYSPKALRSAMSAQFVLDIYQGSLTDIVGMVKPKCAVICADMQGENVFKATIPVPHALLIGNEGNGVSTQALQICDKVISLPMKGELESLNASVCAGILMYQLSNNQEE